MNLLDLPDEILLYILQKLDNVDILYSLFGINNKRLECLCQEERFCNTLNFLSITSRTITMDKIFNRFNNYILPKISNKIKCFIIESAYMERILLDNFYPNLIELKLNFKRENSLHYFTDDSPLRNIFKKIKELILIVNDHNPRLELRSIYTKEVYSHILTYCESLEYFTIKPFLSRNALFLLSDLPSNTFSSSILTYLNVNVVYLTDCFHLLDGRLKQLHTCIINVTFIDNNFSSVHNFNVLPNMKYFSLTYYGAIEDYDNRIHLLVHRMLNLEKLTLYLRFHRHRVFIDPVSLLNEFSMSSSQLRSFNFYLSTVNDSNDLNRYLSENNIKQNLLNIGHHQVLNFARIFHNIATYHIFTLPFEFLKLFHINNILPNIVFSNVIELWVNDIIPFEHDLVLRIAKNFPLLEILNISNYSTALFSGKKLSNNNQSNQIATYTHLKFLDVIDADIDSIELLLNETKTRLPCLNELRIKYDDLRIVTRDFTREETRCNCASVTRLFTMMQFVGSKEYYTYFPLL